MNPNRPLRVCHLAYTFYEFDNRVMRYVRTLKERGDEVDVVALRQAGSPWRASENGVRFYRIQRRARNEKSAAAYLLKLVWFCIKSFFVIAALHARRRYDVVHVHNIPDFLVFSALLPKLTGARVVLDIHDIVPELYAGKFGDASGSKMFRSLVAVEQASCRFADHVIVANDIWHERLIARGVAAAKCTSFVNYPDLRVFKRAPERPRGGDKRFVVLYPGTLNRHQGLDLAIRAFASLKPRMPDAEFHIYGQGPALPELIQLARDSGVKDSVIFKPSVGVAQIATIMAAATVGVVPKRADGFGNEAFSTKIFEFMACGVPVICSRTRIDQYYFNDQLVNFFEPGNWNDLAEKLLRVYRQPGEQFERVRAAEAFARSQSWEVRSADYRSLVDSLVARRARGYVAAASRTELSGQPR
jgi:glycosyltransferase involved in cell wall biosynthesis